MFRTLGLRHLCVINQHNQILGIVTRQDLVAAHSLDGYHSEDVSRTSSINQDGDNNNEKGKSFGSNTEIEMGNNYSNTKEFDGVIKLENVDDSNILNESTDSILNGQYEQSSPEKKSKRNNLLIKKKRKKAEFLTHTIDLEREFEL